MEHKIGEIVTIEGKRYEVVEQPYSQKMKCKPCALHYENYCCYSGYCSRIMRSDRKDIIYRYIGYDRTAGFTNR